jgi:hypothetical protein
MEFILIPLLLVNIISSLVVAGTANELNKSFFLYFVISIFCTPIIAALLLIAVMCHRNSLYLNELNKNKS